MSLNDLRDRQLIDEMSMEEVWAHLITTDGKGMLFKNMCLTRYCELKLEKAQDGH